MSITTQQVEALVAGSGNVYTSGSEKVGRIGQVYLDNATGEPSWVTVKTGLFGLGESFVPLDSARAEGDDLYVNFDQDTIKGAPRIDSDGALDPAEEDRLYDYYGLGTSGTATAGVGTTTGTDYDTTVAHDTTVDHDTTADRDVVGHDTSGPTTDDAITRSEEQVRVGTRTEETGRARLRKYVVTENVTQTVPVSREEVRIEREPITDANVGAANEGPAISEEEHEVILHEERPVVEKEAVPVERIRLDKDTVTEQTTVNEQVRKEEVELDDDTVTGRRDA